MTYTNLNLYILLLLNTAVAAVSGGAFLFFVLTSTMVYDDVREGRDETQVLKSFAHDSRIILIFPIPVDRAHTCRIHDCPVHQWISGRHGCHNSHSTQIWHAGWLDFWTHLSTFLNVFKHLNI
jgi:hypothetical protein